MKRPMDAIARPFDHRRGNGRWDLLCGCRILNAGQAPAEVGLVTGELCILWCPAHAQVALVDTRTIIRTGEDVLKGESNA